MERSGGAHRRPPRRASIRSLCGGPFLCAAAGLVLYSCWSVRHASSSYSVASRHLLLISSSTSSSSSSEPPAAAAGVVAGETATGRGTTTDTNVGKAASQSLADRQSFGFFRDISDEEWTRRQKRARTHRHQASSADKKVTKGLEANRWYMNNYFPLFTCPHQQRVGTGGDGPKWACDPHRLALPRGGGEPSSSSSSSPCLVYSVGSNGNYVFEDGLVKLIGAGTCEIHVFDMSGDYARKANEKKGIFFHHWGLGSSYSTVGRMEGRTYLTLQETMQRLGHVNRTIDVFKIDCEKCEWTSYKDWISDAVDVRQLLIETHGLPTDLGVDPSDFFDGIERAGFAMFSKEPNIHPVVGGKCVEWGYVKLRKEFFGARFA